MGGDETRNPAHRPSRVPTEVILEAMSEEGITSIEAARGIAEKYGLNCSPELIRSAISAGGWRKDGTIPAAPASGAAVPVMEYGFQAILGEIDKRHRREYTYRQLVTWELIVAGLSEASFRTEYAATAFIAKRIKGGKVITYNPDYGFVERHALPWELGAYLPQPVPKYPETEIAAFSAFIGELGGWVALPAAWEDETRVWVTFQHKQSWANWIDRRQILAKQEAEESAGQE